MSLRILPVSLILCFLTAPAIASVSSMSQVEPVKSAAGEAYLQVRVQCSGKKTERRPIWRKEAGGKWCAKDVEGFCRKSKMAAASKVCSLKYSRALEKLTVDKAKSSGISSAPKKITTTDKREVVENSKPVATPALDTPEVVSKQKLSSVQSKSKPKVRAKAVQLAEAKQLKEAAAKVQSKEKADFQRDQLALEKERLLVEQERLELRKQRVRLQQQELELKKQLDKARVASQKKPAPAPEKSKKQESSKPMTVQQKVLGM